MIWLIAGAVGPSLLIAWMAGFAMRRLAPRCGLVDAPGARKIHSTVMPLGGGLTIWLAVLLPFAVGQWLLACFSAPDSKLATWLPADLVALVTPHVAGLGQRSGDLWFLLAAATAMMLLGLADDFRGLDWKPRLSVQTLIAGVVVFGKGWQLTMFVDWPVLTGVLSVVWIVGLTNSFNMLDNMDGLSAGVAAIAAAMLATVLLLAPDPETHGPQLFVAGFLLVLVGALGGFLWHNRPPARLFLGDAGSYFIGFSLSVATLLSTFAGGSLPDHAILAPLCVLAIPLYDTVSVIVIRLWTGRSPFVGDKSHFSHRLVELGLSRPQAVLTIYLAASVCGLGALLLHRVSWVGAVLVLLLVASLLGLIALAEATARRTIGSK